MSRQGGTEPIADDELLYRRIPVSMGWVSSEGLSPEAFDPRKNETTGISVYRAKYKRIDEAAQGKSKQGYYVAVLRAGRLKELGIEAVPRPQPDDPGHAELLALTCDNRLTSRVQELKLRLTQLVERVEGPFTPLIE